MSFKGSWEKEKPALGLRGLGGPAPSPSAWDSLTELFAVLHAKSLLPRQQFPQLAYSSSHAEATVTGLDFPVHGAL